VVAPDGSVVQRERGYAGNPDFTWGLLRTGVKIARERQQELEKRLLKKGYRFWKGENDQKMLARLLDYQDGELLLVGPNGNRYRTTEANLSSKDRKWLMEEKEKSEKRRGVE
jgi:hypothetical protein